VIVLVSLALAAISLAVLPDGVAYDPWSWLIWGRESLHLSLDTRYAATSIKPLPLAVTTLLAVTGKAAPDLWLIVARAAALAGLAIAYRLAARLGGPVAGVLAAVGVATSYQYASYLFFTGMSEPMATATALAAADTALAGRHRQAFAAMLATALLRIEAWPFVAGYAAWRIWVDPAPRRILAAGAALLILPLAWFGVDWLGSGQWLRSAGAASQQSQGGPLLTAHPGLATVTESASLLAAPLGVAFGLTFLAALLWWRRGPAWRALATLGLAALGWLAVAAGMAQARIATGAERYLLPASGLAAVVGAAGIGLALRRLLAGRAGRLAPAAAAALLVVAVVGGSVPRGVLVGRRVSGEIDSAGSLSALARGLSHAVRVAGGHAAIQPCGHVATQPFQVPALAWQARLHLEQVGVHPAPTGMVFQYDGAPAIPAALRARYHRLGATGPAAQRWVVWSTCQPGSSRATRPGLTGRSSRSASTVTSLSARTSSRAAGR
jgi:hypothetical protein